ncbi:cyclin-dependent kinase 9-like [Babylonia areolata]|uniref:cyclin-dependent kinase 9-like n=1 Tax=Babylonia areolata TaxID=304850 RepID=UPI003FD2D1C2
MGSRQFLTDEKDFDPFGDDPRGPAPTTPSVSNYALTKKIGCGTFGEVFKARCKRTNKPVALKKILTETTKEGFPITALREITILQKMKHENIIELMDICYETKTDGTTIFFLVFEFCDHDLNGLIANRDLHFTVPHIKNVTKQLLEALFYIHRNVVIHRDLKTSNILVTKEGVVKLADFGLARFRSFYVIENATYTQTVVTRWYRPPELFLGKQNYDSTIDLWSLGCTIAELFTRRPIMRGESDNHQLKLIASLCGSIVPQVWPGVKDLPLYKEMDGYILQPPKAKSLASQLYALGVHDRYAIDLISKLLTLDPSKRIPAMDALDHDFIWVSPDPAPLSSALKKLESHQTEYLTSLNKRRGLQLPQNNGKRRNEEMGQFRDYIY